MERTLTLPFPLETQGDEKDLVTLLLEKVGLTRKAITRGFKMKIKTKLWGLIFVTLLLFIWAGSSHAVVGKPMIAYSEDETASVQYSQYSSGSWGTAATAPTTTNKQYWKVGKTHPKGNKKVVVSVENPSSGNPHLFASLWDESNWDDGTGSSYNDVKDLGEIYTNSYRCFDAAYEQTSGKLLVVASSPTANTIKTWTWDGSAWTALSNYTFTNTMASVHWIRLASNPNGGSNEIALMAWTAEAKSTFSPGTGAVGEAKPI